MQGKRAIWEAAVQVYERTEDAHQETTFARLQGRSVPSHSICAPTNNYGHIAHSASRRYLIYSEADFEVFAPRGDTLHRWGSPPRAKLHDKGVGPQKLTLLLRFDQNVECKRPTGAYPLRHFHKIWRVCTPFQDAIGFKIWLDLLEGLWSYGGFKFRGLVTPRFSAPPSGETMRQTPKSFRGARTCSRSSITMPSLVGLFVRHAFERESLCARFRHEGVGVQKRFWCIWVGEGLQLCNRVQLCQTVANWRQH